MTLFLRESNLGCDGFSFRSVSVLHQCNRCGCVRLWADDLGCAPQVIVKGSNPFHAMGSTGG